jgi:hypothetical protein
LPQVFDNGERTMTQLLYLAALAHVEDLQRHAAAAKLAADVRMPGKKPQQIRTTRPRPAGDPVT